MTRRALILLLMVALPSYAGAIELVTNGGFETDTSPGWEKDLVGTGAGVTRSTGYDGDPDYEVLVEKGTGNGHGKLDQIIAVPSVDLAFSVNAKIQVLATSDAWAAAGVALHYESYLGDILGTTMIVGKTSYCPWADSGNLHLIEAPDEAWNGYAFNVADELANLADVDPNAIRQIRISLFAQVGDDC
jgi:hypothetical protein